MIATLFLAFLPMALLVGNLIKDDGDDHDNDNIRDDTDNEVGDGEEIQVETSDLLTEGTDGDDTIRGTDGSDTVMGNAGDDNIYLEEGNDGRELTPEEQEYVESAQNLSEFLDRFENSGAFGAVGGTGDDYIDGGHGNDSITGSQGDDTLRGNLGADYLLDFEGSNELYGGYGDDQLYAGDLDGQPDLLDGGANDDYLSGNDGDTMTGGDGTDYFDVYWQSGNAAVTVTDFGQLGPNPDPNSTGEFLEVGVDDTNDVSSFSVTQSGSDSLVLVNGQRVATLENVDYDALKAAATAVYLTDGDTALLPTYA